jgi:hypothetical protein
MAENKSLNLGLGDFGPLDCRWRPQLKEMDRIRNKLEEFLCPNHADDTAMRIYDVAIEVDGQLDRILQDPLVRRFYEYDGQFFTPKQGWGFHRAFDGIHILKSLSDAILETFFYGRETNFAIEWLMDELGTHQWEATLRRINWEESGTLSLVPKEVLDEIMRRNCQSTIESLEDTPLSAEERSFFQPFEDQMAADWQSI